MKAVIFTHPSDYPAARVSSAGLERLGVEVTWCIDRNDDVPAESRRLHFSTTARNGNLRGIGWTREQLRILCEVGGDDPWILKVDADTAVLSLDWISLAPADHVLVGPHVEKRPLAVYGCAYAIRPDAIPSLIAKARTHPQDTRTNEDFLIGKLAGDRATRIPFEKSGGVWCGYDWSSIRPAAAWRSKFQVIHIDRPNGNRAPVTNKLREILDL